ncbi:MAG TPA: thioredoxin domain-containing protein, partial [Gemmatimonadaceae bacterium]|nr:thioredoxin domain-containing protein [Gemmatimonadaceae bacterium]
AECAGEQGRFRAMHDRLYERQHEWKGSGAPDALLAGYAAALQLDRSAFAACYARAAEHPRTARANQAAQALGVRATPSFLVGDRPIEGAPPLAQFRALIEETLGARR